MPPGRLPPPWMIDETDACFIVRDVNGQALAYVYYEQEPGAALGGAPPHPRRGPADGSEFAKLPKLVRRDD